MNKNLYRLLCTTTLALSILLPNIGFAESTKSGDDVFAGYYSRLGNNDTPAKAINSNIYIKLYKADDMSQWVITLFVPYPYAASVDPTSIDKVFAAAKKRGTKSAYFRDKFGVLKEPATVQVERFGYMQDKIIFECGSLSPCTIRLLDGYLELIKPGVINEHIIKYDHVINE